MPAEIKPTLGRIVIYTNFGNDQHEPEQQAAIVTRVREEDKVCLHIFYPQGDFHKDEVPYSEEYARGHWSWPKRD